MAIREPKDLMRPQRPLVGELEYSGGGSAVDKYSPTPEWTVQTIPASDYAHALGNTEPEKAKRPLCDLPTFFVAALAEEAGRRAAFEDSINGLPVTVFKDDKIVTIYPDGREEIEPSLL